VDFQNKGNPLMNLGIIFSVNQILYLLIAMWAFNATPDKMLMIIAIIFGAHLLPYSWLYHSKSYIVSAIDIPIVSLVVVLNFEPYYLAVVIVLYENLFSISLMTENKILGHIEYNMSS